MRVLLLSRRSFGGLATHASRLRAELGKRDVEAHIEFAEDWIPRATGPKVDRAVRDRLRREAAPYDLVHALGYRAAWACAETFGYDEVWVYTAYDMPATTHRMLIDRLNRSQAGICSSFAVQSALDRALALDLTVIPPGAPTSAEERPPQTDQRRALGLPESARVVAALGRWVEESCFGAPIAAMERVWTSEPEARFALAGEGELETDLREKARTLARPDQVHILGRLEDPMSLLEAADLVVVPAVGAGFSMAAVEAMMTGTPVLVRQSGGLGELVDPEVTGFAFQSDEELGPKIAELLAMPVTLESIGRAGRIRALERFTAEECASRVAEVYRTICEDLL